MSIPMAAEKPVDDRIRIILDGLANHEHFAAQDLPGLKPLLIDYLEPEIEVKQTDFIRRFLKVFKDSQSDMTYQEFLARHDHAERDHLEKFVEGASAHEAADGFEPGPTLGLREGIAKLQQANRVHISSEGVHIEGLGDGPNSHDRNGFHGLLHRFADFFRGEHKDHGVTVYQDLEFQNWGRTFKSMPSFTCVPTTVSGVQKIVCFAKQHDLGVRCSGYRHSWSPLFARDGQILISMLQISKATELPNTTSLPLHQSDPTELESIDFVDGTPRQKGNRLVRVGCAATNERLRRWCAKHKKVTLPINVIMVEITLGGSNGPICHGAGRKYDTLSDLVRAIEYVDANGELRKITTKDEGWLTVASGCFGLMGVITHLTLEFSPMTYANMRPTKLPVIEAIPPPPGFPEDRIPPALRPKVPLTEEQKRSTQAAFEDRALNWRYCEWFWFPYSDLCWVNCWQDTEDPTGAESWPSNVGVFLSFVETFSLNVIQNATVLATLAEKVGLTDNLTLVTILSRFAMWNLPDVQEHDKPIKTYLPDALHFQRAIQNIRVRDLEVEMPLPPRKDDPNKGDLSAAQRAWWDAILMVYKHDDTCPLRMPLEMRITGGSGVVMAPQRGNSLGTASIEILTLQNAVPLWKEFAQEVLDLWMSYTDDDGKRIKTKPHWAKEWFDYTVDGQEWYLKLKNEDYKDQIVQFKDILATIGKAHGWTLDDLKRRFSNDWFDFFIFDDKKALKS